MDGSSRQIGEPTGCKLSQFTICVGVWLELRFVINLQLVCWCNKCGSKVKELLGTVDVTKQRDPRISRRICMSISSYRMLSTLSVRLGECRGKVLWFISAEVQLLRPTYVDSTSTSRPSSRGSCVVDLRCMGSGRTSAPVREAPIY